MNVCLEIEGTKIATVGGIFGGKRKIGAGKSQRHYGEKWRDKENKG
jgi:hypothetical protein